MLKIASKASYKSGAFFVEKNRNRSNQGISIIFIEKNGGIKKILKIASKISFESARILLKKLRAKKKLKQKKTNKIFQSEF